MSKATKNTQSPILFLILLLIIITSLISFLCGILFVPALSILAPTPAFTFTSTPTSTLTPSPPPPIYVTLNVNEFSTYAVYWVRNLWEAAVNEETIIEDFENEPDYGELTFPYLTARGFLLTGSSHAQVFNDNSLLESGRLLHFRDWEEGLNFTFPDNVGVRAFGLDYQTSETWQLTFNEFTVAIPKGRNRFLGILLHEGDPLGFVLSSAERVQGGLTVDNIGYVPSNTP